MASSRRAYPVVAGVVLSAAVLGFFAGTRSHDVQPRGYSASEPDPPPPTSIPARTYSELREAAISPNADVYRASRHTLAALLPSPTDPVPERTAENRIQSLERRRARRAYDGAPPTIPHAMDTRARPNCTVCHEQGAKVFDRIAPKMSHPVFQSCPQCHVEAYPRSGLPTAVATPPTDNLFEPLAFGGLGSRAWADAPPVVPHPSFMRERCDSCHGIAGPLGLKTPHPQRQSCQQCHVLDTRIGEQSVALRAMDQAR